MTATVIQFRDYQPKPQSGAQDTQNHTLEQMAADIFNAALVDHSFTQADIDTAPCEYVAPPQDSA